MTASARLATGGAVNRPNRWNRYTSVCSEISNALIKRALDLGPWCRETISELKLCESPREIWARRQECPLVEA